MMDYEYQPANHLSFRLAKRVIVPTAFPEEWLRRCGARPAKTLRYAAFKEELYLAGYVPDRTAIAELNLNTSDAIVVMRAPPDGALYHRDVNTRFEELLEEGRARSDVQTVVLSRTRAQQARYEQLEGAIVPSQPVDGRSLLAHADVVIGGGGTMSRESALLGTPTYTVFSGRLAAVDKALMDDGRLFDLRDPSVTPSFEKKTTQVAAIPSDRRDEILAAIDEAVAAAVGRR
jgi:predicted glycosyltransferase